MMRHRRQSPAAAAEDDGFTLVELLVAMSILIVVLGIFTGAFLTVATGVRKTNSLATAQAQARNAFQLLDRTLRYANAVNDPTSVSGSQYLEYELGDVSQTTALPQTCYQWRVTSNADLQWRSFTISSPLAAAGSQSPISPTWTTVASGLDTSQGPVFSTSPGSAAFADVEPSAAGAVQRQVAVQLRVVNGTNPGGRASTQALFSASNTDTADMPGQMTNPQFPLSVCQQAGEPS